MNDVVQEAFADELGKIAATLRDIRRGAKRVSGITDFPSSTPLLSQFGALTIPTKSHGSLKQRPEVSKIQALQKALMPPEVTALAEKELERAGREVGAGKILMSPGVSKSLDPAASKRLSKNLEAFTALHESAERGVKAQAGSLHLSPQVLMKDMNLLHKLKGPGAEELAESMGGLRAPEFAHLREQASAAMGPRAEQFMQPGSKIPKAMRKALGRTEMPMSPEQAGQIMAEQGQLLAGRAAGA